jgi:hypothetical protein
MTISWHVGSPLDAGSEVVEHRRRLRRHAAGFAAGHQGVVIMDRQDHGDPPRLEDGLLLLEAKW